MGRAAGESINAHQLLFYAIPLKLLLLSKFLTFLVSLDDNKGYRHELNNFLDFELTAICHASR